MEFKLEPYHRNVEDNELLNDLVRVAQEVGNETLTTKEYEKLGKYCVSTVQKRFGSWKNALAKSGLKQIRNWNVSNIEYFENIENVWRLLGRQPRYEDMKLSISSYHPRSYDKRFGTWRNALELFVAYINEGDSSKNISFDDKNTNTSRNPKGKREPSWQLRFIVMRRDNFKCKLCGRTPANDPGVELHIDHITPWSRGGMTVLENLQTLCSVCNIGKSDLPLS